MPRAQYTAAYECFSGVFSTEIFKSEQERVCVPYSVSTQHVDVWELGEKIGTRRWLQVLWLVQLQDVGCRQEQMLAPLTLFLPDPTYFSSMLCVFVE